MRSPLLIPIICDGSTDLISYARDKNIIVGCRGVDEQQGDTRVTTRGNVHFIYQNLNGLVPILREISGEEQLEVVQWQPPITPWWWCVLTNVAVAISS